jgi:chromosome partitioning protein
MSARIISIINQKGGVAKTVTVAHLAMALARKKKTVLCIDMDPQANLSLLLGSLEAGKKAAVTVYDALQVGSKQSLGTSYLDTRDELVKLCYGSLRMAGLERDLITARTLDPSRVLLKKTDSYVQEAFDYVLIDCPPSLSMLTINALTASHYYVVPIPTGDSLALEGVEQLNMVVRDVQEQINPDLRLLGVLLTRYDGRLNISKAIENEALHTFGKRNLFRTHIRQNTLVEQATHLKLTVFEHDGRAPAAHDYQALAEEVIRRCQALDAADEPRIEESTQSLEAPDGEEILSAQEA